jgi:hypothetical protein
MSGLQTYEGVVLWVSPELCVVEEERRAHHISETTWTTTGELGPLHDNHAPSQCAISCELLVACAYKIISIYVCIAKVTYTVQRIAHTTQRMHTKTPHIWPASAPPRHGSLVPSPYSRDRETSMYERVLNSWCRASGMPIKVETWADSGRQLCAQSSSESRMHATAWDNAR